MDITSTIYFMGAYNPNISYNCGAVTLKDGQEQIFTGSTWECLGISSSLETNKVKKYMTNCPNCGAPMHGHKCMYCGTEDYGEKYL